LSVVRRLFRTRLEERITTPLPLISPLTLQFPALMPLRDIINKLSQVKNKHELYRTLKEIDPELYGAIDRISKMVRYSYQGVYVHVGHELDEREQRLQDIARKFAEEHDFKAKFQSIAEHLLTHGDYVALTRFRNGLSIYQVLPIEYLTILEREDQLMNSSAQIFKANLYVLNENRTDIRQIYSADEILHISLNKEASTVRDLLGRYTFGVWSVSPIEALKVKLLWKLSTIYNDILVRQKLVPREHHKLDLSAFDPRFFSGKTMKEKFENAKAEAEKFLDDYKTEIAKIKEPDKSYITSKEVEIDFVEPAKVTYVDPNALLEQIDQSIFSVIGPVETAVTGRGRRTFATELIVASYAVLCAETLADIIKRALLQLVRKHIRLAHPEFTEDDLKKLDIKIQLTLDVLRGEIVRQVAVLSQLGLFTSDELRSLLGFEPLTEEQMKRVVGKFSPGRHGEFVQTPSDVARDFIRRREPVEEPITPESRRERQRT